MRFLLFVSAEVAVPKNTPDSIQRGMIIHQEKQIEIWKSDQRVTDSSEKWSELNYAGWRVGSGWHWRSPAKTCFEPTSISLIANLPFEVAPKLHRVPCLESSSWPSYMPRHSSGIFLVMEQWLLFPSRTVQKLGMQDETIKMTLHP